MDSGSLARQEVAPVSKQAIISRLMGKYPSSSKNKQTMRKAVQPTKKAGGRFSTSFGIRTEVPVLGVGQQFGVPVVNKKEALARSGGRALFGGARRHHAYVYNQPEYGVPELIPLKATITASTSMLAEMEEWVDGILQAAGKTHFQVALIAEAFRPTYEKALRYTPFNPYQRTRQHLLESAEFDYGVQGNKSFVRASWGGIHVPHAKHVYDAPESWDWQGEGRPRWLEKAIEENFSQFTQLVEEFLFASIFTEKAFKAAGEPFRAETADKFLEMHMYQSVGAALQGEEAFQAFQARYTTGSDLRGGRGLQRHIQRTPITAEQFLERMGQFVVPSGYSPD